ncbi:OLC1v1031318C1 [Oldenlandia corymbosa var. corymbosa]|uniref:OLC1v1031318C1 n=1 Tax=Oldenlandia corymbosa var. corymbosa TaxID=529605 RepID=A0AAV1CL43_OLDCO|nr:OLC1v1031318C1 [Oldenlandia corymbosa var. corymbosa]
MASNLPDPEKDPYGYFGLRLNSDGSITRLPEPPGTPASADPSNPHHLSKDIPINQSKATWARIFVDEWLEKYADFSRCFLMGTSAGGTIAYHVGLRAAAGGDDLMPVQIKGLVLHHAFFGGIQRTDSEVRLAHDKVVPLCVTDLAWQLCLPVGADRDHEHSNPMVGIKAGHFDAVKTLEWKFLFVGYYGDPLVDRQIELAKTVEENGLTVVKKFYEGGFHGCDIFDPSRAEVLRTNLQEFIGSAVNS